MGGKLSAFIRLFRIEHAVILSAAVLLGLSAVLPDFVAFLQLPPPFNWSDKVCLVLSLVFIWDVFRHAGELRRKK